MAELRQPSTPQSVSPPCCRVCLLFQGGEAVLSPQDPFPGAELAGIKCSDLRGFSVTHHLIIPQLLPAAVCSGEFTAIALPVPHPIPHSRFCCCHPCPKRAPQAPGSSCQAARGRADGTRGKGELFPAQPSGKTEPKGLSARGGHPALSLLSLCCARAAEPAGTRLRGTVATVPARHRARGGSQGSRWEGAAGRGPSCPVSPFLARQITLLEALECSKVGWEGVDFS